jgi:cytochrome c-type biogenesis protein CcmH/NrfG
MKEDELNEELLKVLLENEARKAQIRDTIQFVNEAADSSDLKRSRLRKAIRLVFVGSAACAAIVVLSIFLIPSFTPMNAENQFLSYYQKFDANQSVRGQENPTPWLMAYSKYQTGQMKEAEELVDSLITIDPNDHKMVFLSGLISIELDQYQKAEDRLKTTADIGGSYELYSRWYLALNYLRQEMYSQCRKQLIAIKQSTTTELRKSSRKIYRKIRFRRDM